MRHRIIDGTICGLGGNNAPELLSNNWSDIEKFNNILKDCFYDAIDTFTTLNEIGGLDFQIDKHDGVFSFGYEPGYMYEELFIISIDLKDINNCYIKRGKAWGVYGSNIVSTKKYYHQYKNKCKFKTFIDKWFSKCCDTWKNAKEEAEKE